MSEQYKFYVVGDPISTNNGLHVFQFENDGEAMEEAADYGKDGATIRVFAPGRSPEGRFVGIVKPAKE